MSWARPKYTTYSRLVFLLPAGLACRISVTRTATLSSLATIFSQRSFERTEVPIEYKLSASWPTLCGVSPDTAKRRSRKITIFVHWANLCLTAVPPLVTTDLQKKPVRIQCEKVRRQPSGARGRSVPKHLNSKETAIIIMSENYG
ncbi:hypothetical protein B0T11DRAFT_54299 [Plectosphaerella cucumerina]|uniref:Uncharacterized protein n=1 Tax=Plectosphaerella cucumerina TaxID=40658 RepID=A0A8K0X6E7_9PEZI|nr:hypothetical protein B0T11DRAFT_54299 [Plectosphaerella cucumerina]